MKDQEKEQSGAFTKFGRFVSLEQSPFVVSVGGPGCIGGPGGLVYRTHDTMSPPSLSGRGQPPPAESHDPPPHPTHTATSLGKGPCGLQSRDPWPPRGPASPQGERQEDYSPGTTNQERERESGAECVPLQHC